MKKKVILITVFALATLLFLTACSSSNNSNNQGSTENQSINNNDITNNDINNNEMTNDLSEVAEEEMTEALIMTNEGDMAKQFELMDLKGNAYSLEELKGEKVYIKFWASWCSICLAGLDELNEFSAKDHDFKVLTIVSPDYNGEKSLSKFKAWFDKQGADNLTVLIDEDGDIARAYGVRGYPTSAFIGSDGVLVYMFPGHLNSEIITEQFDEIY